MKSGTMSEMLADMKNGLHDFTENGECSGCGECCSNILPVTEAEIARIRRYIKKHGIKEQRHTPPTVMPVMDFTCPFRNNADRKCEIYEVRPEICRDFRCDNMRNGIGPSAELVTGNRRLVRMREEFFGGKDGKSCSGLHK